MTKLFNNETFNVAVGDKVVRVSFMGGKPWIAQVLVRLPYELSVRRTSTRVIWFRPGGKPMAGLARKAFDIAMEG